MQQHTVMGYTLEPYQSQPPRTVRAPNVFSRLSGPSHIACPTFWTGHNNHTVTALASGADWIAPAHQRTKD